MKPTADQLRLALSVARTILQLYPGGNLRPNVVSRDTDTQVLVEKLPDGRFGVHLPGTASLRDAMTDLMIPKVSWHSGYIHMGVRRAWRSVDEGVRQLIPSGADVVIDGHSLGGGIAQAAADELQGYCNVTQIITFGAMRTFNRQAALAYNARFGSRSLRFVNKGDLVPHGPLPLPVLRTGMYWQTDTELYFNDAGQIETGRPWYSSLPPVLRGAAAAVQRRLNPQDVARFVKFTPHFMVNYIKRLEALT